jgi:hypothetical protein
MLRRSKAISIIMAFVFCMTFLAPVLTAPQKATAAVTYETLTAPNVSTDDTRRPDLGTVKVSIPDVRVFSSNASVTSISTALAGVSAGTVYASYLTVGLPSGLEFDDDSIGTAIGTTGYYAVEANNTLEFYVFGKKTSKTTWDLLVVRGDFQPTDGDYSTDFIIPFNGILVKNGSGNIDATFSSSDSAFPPGTATIAKIGDGATTTMAKSVKTIGDAGGYIDSLILIESMPGVLKDGDEIEFRLPSGFSWSGEGTAWVKGGWGLTGQNNAAVGAGNVAFSLRVDSDERILILKVENAFNPTTSNTTAGRVVIGSDSNNANSFMKIDVDDTAKFGDIEVSVSCDQNSNVTEQDVIVAKYGDYGVTVNEGTKTDVIAGHDAQEIGEFTIEEGIPNSLVANRTVVLELPEGVKWVPGKMPKISATDGDNLFLKDKPFEEVSGSKLRSIKAKIDDSSSTDRSKASTLKLKDAEVYVTPGFEGPIEITVSGSAGAEGKVVVANCVKAVSLTADPSAVPAVIIGEMNQKASDIIITENQKGAIMHETDHDTIIVELDSGVYFAKKPTITVEEGNFEFDSYKLINSNNAIEITTKYESTKASKIRISDILLTLNRTVPEGAVKATLAYADGGLDTSDKDNAFDDNDYSGSTALDEAYLLKVNGDKKFSRESAGDVTIANTITPAVQGASATFKVASNIYNVNGIAKVMDAAPYVKNDRTYVPMRFLGYALGLNDDQILWDETAQTVTLTKGDIVVVFTIGSTTYTVAGEAKTADVAPEIVDGRTMLPARYVAEAFGATVGWDQASQTVLIEVK